MNAKDLLFIEKILKNKNERKTGGTMEKTQVIYLFLHLSVLVLETSLRD